MNSFAIRESPKKVWEVPHQVLDYNSSRKTPSLTMKTYCTLALLLVLLAACREPSPTIPPKQLV